MAQNDSVKIAYDLDDLHFRLEAVRAELVDDDEPSPTPTINHHQPIDKPEQEPIKASRFAQIRSKFRFARKSSSPTDSPFADTSTPFVQSSSIDLNLTLVNPLPYHPLPVKDDTRYLTLLAPLVTTLQRLAPSIQTADDNALRAISLQRADDLSDLLKELKKDIMFSPLSHADEVGDDMRLLLLTALHKKVLLERSKCATPQTRSPLSPIVDIHNPFIVHSSGMASRTPSPPKPIAPVINLPPGGFSDFMGHSQQTWRADVHRLGSFQASALFSPSPIAVNRAMRGVQRL